MQEPKDSVLDVAKFLRKSIRAKAGLELDWDSASEEMKQHYMIKAKELMEDIRK